MSKLPDQPKIPCPSCGEKNRISNPFCKECGGRMYKDGAAPIPSETRTRGARQKAVRSFVISLCILIVVAIIALALWPHTVVEVPKAVDRSRQVERYLDVLERLAGTDREVPPLAFPQRNLNAYLGKNADPEDGKVLGVLLSESRILLVANEPFGPFHVSTRLVMKPSELGGGFEPEDLWVGHLPLPSLWATPWTQGLAKRFELGIEPGLWDTLRITEVSPRQGMVIETSQGTP